MKTKIGKIIIVIFICMGLAFLPAQSTKNDKKTQETEKKETEKKEAETEATEATETPFVPVEPEPGLTEPGLTEPGLSEDEIITGDFIYKPKGRRDPFWDLLQGKSVKVQREQREGIGGMLIEELELEGIIYKGGAHIALFKGPDGKPYDVKVGDSVYDGEVIKIDINSVVFKRLLTIALGGTKEKITIISLVPEEEASKQ